jgi:hypothetical protein
MVHSAAFRFSDKVGSIRLGLVLVLAVSCTTSNASPKDATQGIPSMPPNGPSVVPQAGRAAALGGGGGTTPTGGSAATPLIVDSIGGTGLGAGGTGLGAGGTGLGAGGTGLDAGGTGVVAGGAGVGAAGAPEPDAAVPQGGAGNRSDDLASPSSMRGNALTDAYAALSRGDRSALPGLINAIDQSSAANPDDHYAVFYAGTFRLWQLAETLNVLAAPGALDRLGRAHELLPMDFRVTGFYGLTQVLSAALGGGQSVAAGLETLALGVQQHSTYGHFLRATAVSLLSATDPAFKTALSDMQGFGPDCGVTVDPEGTYHYPTDELAGRSRTCTNDGIVPHVWEGYFISFGDIALKSGLDAARARAIYSSAKTAPTYDKWPFKQELERRIDNAELNAAAYADGSTLNDPTVWALGGKICVGCHQQ